MGSPIGRGDNDLADKTKERLPASADSNLAQRFEEGEANSLCAFPKSAKATAVNGSSEYELILQRGTRFRVTGPSERYIDLEAL